MIRNTLRAVGLTLFVALIMPAGMLLATETYHTPAVTSSTANWYDVEQASSLFKRVNTQALKVRKEVAVLQVTRNQLNWREHAARLRRAADDINTIGDNLTELNRMKSRLEPWQQSLIDKITPEIHEMVYQTDAALSKLRAHEDLTYLSLATQYHQNIDRIYSNANQMADVIHTVIRYARAEQKMAALNRMNGTESGS